MKILITMYGWNESGINHSGGGTSYPRQLATALQTQGHEVCVLYAGIEIIDSTQQYILERRKEKGITLIGIHNRPTIFLSADQPYLDVQDPSITHFFDQLILEFKPDVIHCHNFLGLSMGLLSAPASQNIPIFFTLHNYWLLCPTLYLRWPDGTLCQGVNETGSNCLNCTQAHLPGQAYLERQSLLQGIFAERIHTAWVASQSVKKILCDKGYPTKQIEVLHLAHEQAEHIWQQTGQYRPPFESGSVRFGFMGSLVAAKGVHILLEAVQLLTGDFSVVIYGSGPDEYVQNLKAQIKSDNIYFAGPFHTNQQADLLQSLDVGIVPSTVYEQAGLVISEFLAARIPVLGADIGGIPEYIGGAGATFPVGDVAALAKSMQALIDSPTQIAVWQANIVPPTPFINYIHHLEQAYQHAVAAPLPVQIQQPAMPQQLYQLYPELQHISVVDSYLLYSICLDLAFQCLNGIQTFSQHGYVHFIRLGETFLYSRLTPTHLTSIESFLRYLGERANQFLQEAAMFQPFTPVSEINQLMLRALLASPDEQTKLQPQLVALKTHLSQSGQFNLASQLEVFIEGQNTHLQSAAKQINWLYEKAPTEIAKITIEPNILAQAYRQRSDMLTQYNGKTVNYKDITWRANTIKFLWQAEYPDRTGPFTLLAIDSDDTFIQSLAKFQWQIQTILAQEFDGKIASSQQPVDVITLWHLQDFSEQSLVMKAYQTLSTGGLLIAAVPRSYNEPQQIRSNFNHWTGEQVHLIDREAYADALIVYLFKNDTFSAKMSGLMVIPAHSVWSFRGEEHLLYTLQSNLKKHHIAMDLSISLRLNPEDYDFCLVVGTAHETQKLRGLQHFKKPIVSLPIYQQPQHTAASEWGQERVTQLRKQISQIPIAQCLEEFTHLHSLPLVNSLVTPIGALLKESCDYFLPASHTELDSLLGERLSQDKYEHLYHGTNKITLLKQATERAFTNTYHLKNFILCIGRLETNKNQLMLCYALRHTDIPIVLIGTETEPGYVELCQMWGPERILHLPGLPDEMVASALKAAKLFVLPSYAEVFPIVTVEAALAQCPVVVTQNSGQSEYFGEAFYYCNPGDPEHIQQVILQAYQADNQDKIQQAYHLASENCQSSSLASQLTDVFHMLHLQQQGITCQRIGKTWYQYLEHLKPVETPTLPLLYNLSDLTPLFQLKQPELESFLSATFKVATDLGAWHLQQMGLTTCPWDVPSAPHLPQPLALDSEKTYQMLCIYDLENIFGWKETLIAYLNSFQATDDINLLIYVSAINLQSDYESNILAVFEDAGIDPESCAEITIINEIVSQDEEIALFLATNLIVFPLKSLWPYERFWQYIADLPIHLVSYPFHHKTQATLNPLSDWNSLCQQKSTEKITVDEEQLKKWLLTLYHIEHVLQ